MEAKQFGVFYIPRVDINTKKINAVEIAPYWKHPQRGVLHYQHFSSISADVDMGRKLFEWLFTVGLHQFRRLNKASSLKLVFNLEFQLFSQGYLIEKIQTLLQQYNIPGDCIELDLNQLPFDGNIDLIESCMDNLKAFGIRFGLNGFGSELTSLLNLQRLPIETLKLDKRLIKTIHKNSEDARLVKAIIDFAHTIDKKVIADGVLSKAQLVMLQRAGCDQCKGQADIGVLSFKQLQQRMQKASLQTIDSVSTN